MSKNIPSIEKPDFKSITDINKRIDTMCQYCLTIRSARQIECLELGQEALKLSQKNSYTKGEANSLSIIGFQHWNMSEIEKGLKEAEMGYSIMQTIKAYDLMGDNGMVRAMIIWGKGEYERAFSIVYDTLNTLEENQVKLGTEYLFWSLGVFYYDLKDYEKSIVNYQKAYDILSGFKKPDLGFYCYILIGLGTVSNAIKNYEEAVKNFNQALEISKKTGHWLEEARSYFELGSIKITQGSFKEAEEYLWKSYDMRKKHNTKPGMVSSLLALSDLKLDQNKGKKALDLLKEALQLAEETGSKPKVYHTHQKLAELFKRKGDFQKAYKHIEKFYAIKSEVAGEEASNMLKDLETNYATEKSEKEKEIHRLKNVELKKANKDIAEKNKEIMDSINYAKRIQEAILPPDKVVKKYLVNSFVLYIPKDIVAGDFYWLDTNGDDIYFAAADCTGHGVPGAMVSVVCSNALHRTVKEMKIQEPCKILDKVRELVAETFEKSEEDVKDGMDISFCKLNLKTRKLSYAGAHNSLYRITNKNGEIDKEILTSKTHILLEYKGDKQPIGKFAFEKPFTQKEIQLLEGDSIYISSDGYPDQFGGEKGKKLMYKPFKKLFLSIHQEDMEKQKNILIDSFEKWKGLHEQVDDVCVIGVRV